MLVQGQVFLNILQREIGDYYMMQSDGFGLNLCLYNNKTFLLVGVIPIGVVSLELDTVSPLISPEIKYS
jgi:hypothetical protein